MSEHALRGPTAVFEAAKRLDSDISGMSWGGFNLFGDRRSIRELERLLTLDSHVAALRGRLIDLQAAHQTPPAGTQPAHDPAATLPLGTPVES